ncbi:NUDIX hydrolase [Nitrospirillum viridazoti]|uniref:ADP-ribose pyrophosphatase YjhB (NUDIX family) n=1 Tax=Nitrospirillum amazonense TaxID=28077 RepID=A0A560J0S2_9PROT|nr:NUDIX domain-containing protein [Nitrospirillum amazonense]TWB62230.1 ADP-ribose pyrophosphatase YjhB (NUDIX family) [Nitrospirillum amazonense]
MIEDLMRPILTVDVIPLVLKDGRMHVALQRRDRAPHANEMALIGGYVRADEDESATAAALRVLREKAGITPRLLEQLMTFSGAGRDPRGWSASIAYYALQPAEALPADRNLVLTPLDQARGLPFDHDAILAKAADRWRRRAAYSTLPAFLLPPHFTLSALRAAYETVLGRALNDSAFRRKIDELRVIQPIAGASSKATARPAQLYQLSHDGVTEFDRTL